MHVLFLHSFFSSTSTFLAWTIFYLWENIFTWSSQLKFKTDPKKAPSEEQVFPNLPFQLFVEAGVLHANTFPTFWLVLLDNGESVFYFNFPILSWFS